MRPWIGFGIFGGFIIATIVGFGVGDEAIVSALAEIEAWLFSGAIRHPSLFLLGVGFFLGFYVLSLIVKSALWHRDKYTFEERLQSAFRHDKAKFHHLANQAYGRWRKQNDGQPKTLDALIDKTAVPRR